MDSIDMNLYFNDPTVTCHRCKKKLLSKQELFIKGNDYGVRVGYQPCSCESGTYTIKWQYWKGLNNNN